MSRFGFTIFLISTLHMWSVAHAALLADPYVKAVYSLPLTLDPVKMNDTASLVAGNLLYSGLLKFSPTLKVTGDLAEKWETSTDGKIVRFTLRKGAKFHNLEEVSSSDVVGSLTRAMSNGSRVAKYYDCIEGADEFVSGKSNQVSGLRAIDKHTVEIQLKYPFPPFLSVLAGGTAKILPIKLVREGFFEKPIGSGPFKFLSKKMSAKELLLTRFEEYHLGKPALQTLILKELSEVDALFQAKLGKVHDLANWPLSASNEIFQIGKQVKSPLAATWIIGINSKIAPFNSKELRAAFRDTFDTDAFRKKFFEDAIPANGYVPPGLPGYQTKHSTAKKLTNHNSKATIRISIPVELAQHEEMKAFIESSYHNAGWKVEVVPTAWEKIMEGYGDKSLQAFLVSMNMDYPDTEFLLRNFESTNTDNFSGLNDPKIDELLHKARSSRDRKDREKFYRQSLDRIEDAAVTINLFHPRSSHWVSECVDHFEANMLSDVYIDYSKVRINPDCSMNLKRASL